MNEISVINQTRSKTGGQSRKKPVWMIKAAFSQHLFSLSDPPHVEDQLKDRYTIIRSMFSH